MSWMKWASLLLALLLGNQSFPVREASELALRGLGILVWPVLERMQTTDPEVRLRVERLLLVQRTAWLERHLAARSPLPWLDALPRDWPGRQELVDDYVVHDHNEADGDYHDRIAYREATRQFLRDRVAGGMTPRQVLDLVASMERRYSLWSWEENRYSDE